LRTDELIAALATNAGPAPTRRGPARITIALMGGVSASTLACLTCLGANPALLTMGTGLAVKLAYVRGSKPEPPKIPSADQRGLSRARSMG